MNYLIAERHLLIGEIHSCIIPGNKANQITLLVSRPPVSMRAGSHYSLFIIQYYGILRVWFPRTAQIISKKEVWLVFQGDNEGRSGRLKQTREVMRN